MYKNDALTVKPPVVRELTKIEIQSYFDHSKNMTIIEDVSVKKGKKVIIVRKRKVIK